MNIFLKEWHSSPNQMLYLGSGIICAIFVLMLLDYRYEHVRIWVLWVLFVLIIATILIAKRFHKMGLYISKERIYYKGFFTKKTIDPSKIAAIKVTKTITGGTITWDEKDKYGNQLYSMILVKNIDGEMFQHSSGDVWFISTFRRHVICRCIYDQAAITYLLSLNPNIVYMV